MKYRLFAMTMALFYLFSSFTVFAEEESTPQSDTVSASTESDSTSTTITETSSSSEATTEAASLEEQGILTDSDKGCVIETDASSDSLELVGEGIMLMEASTGTVLYSKNADTKYYPASITKVMTTLVALENSKLTDTLTFQADTLNAIEQGSSRIGVVADEEMTVEDALYCVMLASGNDTAAGVAEYVGGTIDNFVEMMNAKAEELGCTNTHFMNPHGLHDENHYTTPKDMALILQAAIQNPDFCKIASSKSHTVPATNKSESREIWNHHKMLLPASEYHYDGVAEGKTGYTTDAWNTLVTTAEKDGMKLIAVDMRCQGAASAYSDTTKLFNYGFENYHLIQPLKDLTLETLADNSDISIGEVSNLQALEAYYNQSYTILAPTSVTADNISITVTGDGTEDGTWGSIHFSYNGTEIGKANIYYNEQSEAAAIVTEDTSTQTKTVSKIPYILTGIMIVLILIILYLIFAIVARK
jgi:D-alanyl-D-alanine carboxypeptidase